VGCSGSGPGVRAPPVWVSSSPGEETSDTARLLDPEPTASSEAVDDARDRFLVGAPDGGGESAGVGGWAMSGRRTWGRRKKWNFGTGIGSQSIQRSLLGARAGPLTLQLAQKNSKYLGETLVDHGRMQRRRKVNLEMF
jgi:hypothetical protein